jgi:imidazolonepropionase
MKKILFNPACIISVNTNGKNFKAGTDQSDIFPVYDHSIVFEDGTIKDLIPNSSFSQNSEYEIIDVKGKTILPGLVECHTHTAFAGSRANEFREKISGVRYEEIARRGGGINATVQSVRKATFEELVNLIKPRIDNFISQGITTLEIKSGYGLDFENELKLLQVINYLNEIYQIDIVPTFLGAHTVPNNFKDKRKEYLNLITEKMLPYISKQNLAVFCDGFCEETAFNSEEMDLVFNAASKLGFKLKLHTEQFKNIGGLDIALKYNAVTVDHLEVLRNEDIDKLKKSQTTTVLLPGVSFFLNYNYSPARDLIRNNIPVALATDYNPGSSHISSIFLIMSLAALQMKMTVEEIISAVTINAAKALCLEKSIGSIEPCKDADFAVYSTNDYADIIYSIGNNLTEMTIKKGNIIYKKSGVL